MSEGPRRRTGARDDDHVDDALDGWMLCWESSSRDGLDNAGCCPTIADGTMNQWDQSERGSEAARLRPRQRRNGHRKQRPDDRIELLGVGLGGQAEMRPSRLCALHSRWYEVGGGEGIGPVKTPARDTYCLWASCAMARNRRQRERESGSGEERGRMGADRPAKQPGQGETPSGRAAARATTRRSPSQVRWDRGAAARCVRVSSLCDGAARRGCWSKYPCAAGAVGKRPCDRELEAERVRYCVRHLGRPGQAQYPDRHNIRRDANCWSAWFHWDSTNRELIRSVLVRRLQMRIA